MLRRQRGAVETPGRGAVLAYALLAAVTLCALADPARAAADEKRSLVRSQAAGVVADRRSEGFGSDERAEELYLDGMEKLAAGHAEWAGKTFEGLIARFPNSPAAALARLRLGELGRLGAPGAGAGAAAPAKAFVRVPDPGDDVSIGASPAWEQELRRNASIQMKLRMEAGDRVFFSSGSAELGSRARAALGLQAQWLKQWHEFEAAIEGHADEPGSDAENLKLSEARAEAVRRRLLEEGVAPGRLAVVVFGRTQRIAPCPDPACAAQNRRVVTQVFASGTQARLGLAAPKTASALQPAGALQAPRAAPQPAAAPIGVAR